LKRAPAWAERAIDRTSTLSNRAVAYIDNGEADLAYDDAVDAVKFLRHAKIESSDRGLNWAHTLRTKADALRLMADQRRPASEVREFRGLLNEAIQDLQHALSWLPVGDPTALHLQITALLGVTERDLGTFLANTESTSNKEEAASHLYRAICSFGSVLTYDADLREDLLKEINHIAQMLMILTPSAEDAWQISEICEKVITGLNDQKEYINNINIYHELFRQSFSRFIKKVCKTSFVGKSKKINALTEFIASLGVTESEAPEILAATLRRLGWDKSINLSPEAALVEGSREITSRGSAEPRADWRDVRKGDEDVFQFVEREFAAELAAGRMHKGLLSRYKNLRRDFYAYQRHHELPRELRMIPKKQEWLDRQVAEGKVKSTSAARSLHRDVVRVARARKRGVEPKL
ncbi:MAG TPA: hypothetical protein VNF29_02430, partial [Candidatus Binataceae bacterium]|nr:hypothetical protein [Candidatus Binataceae bacterium]